MMQKSMTTLPIDEIRPYENNPRINDDAVEAVCKSIEQCGYIAPIVVDEYHVVLAGHTRLKALKQMGATHADVLVVSGLSDARKQKYRLLDNKTGELALWDFDKLAEELEGLDFNNLDLDWFIEDASGDYWFVREDRDDNERQEGNDEYNDFLDKFEEKKTTDDCYTPDNVYDAVADWVAEEYGLNRKRFCRPFYPGGDYQRHNYAGKVVVDNPPFSILAEIMRFYVDNDIMFFLFAPALTLFSPIEGVSFLTASVTVTYENGAKINTSFVTNLESEYIVRTVPDLYEVVKAADDKNREENRAELPKYEYPANVITSARMTAFSKNGVDFRVKRGEAHFIRELDAQKESKGGRLYGGGFLIGDERAKQAEEARKQAEEARKQAEEARKQMWELSDREKEIIRNLG